MGDEMALKEERSWKGFFDKGDLISSIPPLLKEI